MTAAVLHKNYGWQRLYIFCISYFLIRGLSPPTASNDLNNVSNSFYAGKIISSPQLSSTLLKAKNKTTEISTTMKLAKLFRLVQYWSLASLLLLSGDICPNPGWASSVLNSCGLKIAHLNIRSLPKHLDEFKIFMTVNPLNVICLSETWLNSTWSDNALHIDGYNIIRRDRDDSQRGGGTAIYYSMNFMARQRPDLSITDIETVWLELTLPTARKPSYARFINHLTLSLMRLKLAWIMLWINQPVKESRHLYSMTLIGTCFLEDCQELLENSCYY